MSNAPGATDNGTTCPVCGSENIEELDNAGGVDRLEYQCRDCSAEFDPSGGRIDVD